MVVTAPDDIELVGRRVAWDGRRVHGKLGDAVRDEELRRLLTQAPDRSGCRALPSHDLVLYVERVAPPTDLVIVGAGHIAQPLSRVGKLLGFRVVVIDDRPDFARRERFPEADRVLVADFDDPFADVPIGPRSHVVLVTRGHRYDYDCARALARAGAEPAYLGMIGSRRRIRAAFEQLAGEGFDRDWLARIHAPIGLDIEAETPAEIAIAIGAEMVLVRRGGTGAPLRDRKEVVRYVKSLAAAAVEGVSGSAPGGPS